MQPLGLSYWLPKTEFTLRATRTQRIVAANAGLAFAPEVAVTLASAVKPDRGRRHQLRVDVDLLENVSVDVELDDNGVIQSINSQTSSAFAIAVSLAAKVVSLAAPFALDVPEPLDQQWSTAHPGLSARLKELTKKVENLLAVVSGDATSAEDTVTAGTALKVCQTQLAAISRARREWIARHAAGAEVGNWTLVPKSLIRVTGALPDTLVDPDIPAEQADAAGKFGVAVAISDPDRGKVESPPEEVQEDQLIIRSSRPASVGVYTCNEKGEWVLDPSSITYLDIVDEFSPYHEVSIDQRGLRSRTFKIAYHPDGSVKTFGLGSESAIGTLGPALGELMDAASAARKSLKERPSVEALALEKAKTQLDLLSTTTEYEVLAATHQQAAELAALEQKHRLAELSE